MTKIERCPLAYVVGLSGALWMSGGILTLLNMEKIVQATINPARGWEFASVLFAVGLIKGGGAYLYLRAREKQKWREMSN